MPYIVETWDTPDSCEEAERFLKGDPFFQVGLFERFTVTRWRKAYLASECCL